MSKRHKNVGGRFSRKEEEFIADFYLLAKRTLNPRAWDLFQFHFLQGADWRACCQRLHLDRGEFWHEVYRVEETVGKAAAELQPYALWPLNEYFANARQSRGVAVKPPLA
jgi:hypothetical protein